ncbi:hypothetical protein Skr01_42490 [Sphaerisporangium krabiense]|uniref:Uncharacterized protein n=1 Tax=Sphaerisporangium krabiense TaxID=763782 RepID=A0A7W8Z0Z3_9ACTN|nr:hypothetical protein [Sphaerisporangium krabiense]MBB5625322.1 hypothetical protein [Sphaerisporangium krabiense]GII64164.1 hypothetical protein Skr01_42490 [Sphaerisporangium krabiense]
MEAVEERHAEPRDRAAGAADARTPDADDATRRDPGAERAVSSQVLWDSTLAASRLDQEIEATPEPGGHVQSPPAAAGHRDAAPSRAADDRRDRPGDGR